MNGNNPFDTSQTMGYNSDNNDAYEVIDLSKKQSLNDPNCEHELVADPSDKMGDHVAYVCRKCGVGTFLPDPQK